MNTYLFTAHLRAAWRRRVRPPVVRALVCRWRGHRVKFTSFGCCVRCDTHVSPVYYGRD